MQVNAVAFMPAFGVATAGAILAGQAIGAGAHAAVGRILRLTLSVTMAWMGAIGLLYLAIPDAVMGLFAQDDSKQGVSAGQLVAVGAPMLAISSTWQLFDAAALAFFQANSVDPLTVRVSGGGGPDPLPDPGPDPGPGPDPVPDPDPVPPKDVPPAVFVQGSDDPGCYDLDNPCSAVEVLSDIFTAPSNGQLRFDWQYHTDDESPCGGFRRKSLRSLPAEKHVEVP